VLARVLKKEKKPLNSKVQKNLRCVKYRIRKKTRRTATVVTSKNGGRLPKTPIRAMRGKKEALRTSVPPKQALTYQAWRVPRKLHGPNCGRSMEWGSPHPKKNNTRKSGYGHESGSELNVIKITIYRR